MSSASEYDETKEQLNNVSEQLNRVELLLNNSMNQLLNKIDQSNHEIIHLFKSHSTSLVEGKQQSSTRSVNALLIIDVQYDFIDGSLSLRKCPSKQNGEEVIPVINNLLDSIDFDVVVYTHDWHPSDHISFFDNIHLRSHYLTNDSIPLTDLQVYSTATFDIPGVARMEQVLWPAHCVQNTSGAELHSDLKIINENNTRNLSVIHINKGTKSNIDSYSAFWDNLKLSETNLHKLLTEKQVTQVFLTGLATDYCVYFSSIDALEHGYKTFIIEDACRGVDPITIKEKLNNFTQKDGQIIQSNQVKDYI